MASYIRDGYISLVKPSSKYVFTAVAVNTIVFRLLLFILLFYKVNKISVKTKLFWYILDNVFF